MTKVIAIVLLLVFAASMALPAFFSDSESTLPACCRRDGKHHCAMMDMAQQDQDGPSWKATPQKCAQFPKNSVGFCVAKSIPLPSGAVAALIPSEQTVKAKTEALYRILHNRTRDKRGPPFLA